MSDVAINVIRVTDETALRNAHDRMVEAYDPETQCSPNAFWPSMGEILRSPRVYAARENGTLYAACLVRNDGRITWIKGRKGRLPEALVALCIKIYTDCGACYGTVQNANLRARFTAQDARIVEDGATLRWVP